MFITHYNNKFINCENSQFDMLVYTCKSLFKIYSKSILESDILNALYENDDIYYSASYLFSSKKPLSELYPNYCCLAKLVYKYFNKQIYSIELDSIVSNMCAKRIPLDLLYDEYY